jgi:uncharacterized protein YozE (UPF0346 family)
MRVRTQIIEDTLQQIENNVFIDTNSVKPQLKSRDFNKIGIFLSEQILRELCQGFLNKPTVEPFEQSEDYPTQIKDHDWWKGAKDFKNKARRYMESLSDHYLPDYQGIRKAREVFTPLTELKVEFEKSNDPAFKEEGEDKDENSPRIWEASPDQITKILDYIGSDFFLSGENEIEPKFKYKFGSSKGYILNWSNLKHAIDTTVENYLDRTLTPFEPPQNSIFTKPMQDDDELWGTYKGKIEQYLSK